MVFKLRFLFSQICMFSAGPVILVLSTFAPVIEKCKERSTAGKVGRKVGQDGAWGVLAQVAALGSHWAAEGNHSYRGSIPWIVRQEHPGNRSTLQNVKISTIRQWNLVAVTVASTLDARSKKQILVLSLWPVMSVFQWFQYSSDVSIPVLSAFHHHNSSETETHQE